MLDVCCPLKCEPVVQSEVKGSTKAADVKGGRRLSASSESSGSLSCYGLGGRSWCVQVVFPAQHPQLPDCTMSRVKPNWLLQKYGAAHRGWIKCTGMHGTLSRLRGWVCREQSHQGLHCYKSTGSGHLSWLDASCVVRSPTEGTAGLLGVLFAWVDKWRDSDIGLETSLYSSFQWWALAMDQWKTAIAGSFREAFETRSREEEVKKRIFRREEIEEDRGPKGIWIEW